MPDWSDIYKEVNTPTVPKSVRQLPKVPAKQETQVSQAPRAPRQHTAAVQPETHPVLQNLPRRPAAKREHRDRSRSVHTRDMAGAQQYSFPPPPPPPGPPPHHQQQQPQYGYAQPPQYQQARGGGPPRGGRGGLQGGRGDFHPSPFPHQQQQQPYNGPPQTQGPPHGYNGPPNHQQNPAPYIGPQAHPPQPQQGPPHNNYGPPQWQQPEHHGPGPQHHSQPPMAHTQHAPPPHAAPLAASNYHPNYAPQVYQQQPPAQYGPQQPQHQPPPQFQPPQQFGHNVPQVHQPPHAGPPQWSPPPQHSQQQQFNARGRGGRGGGFVNGRGGHEAPLMGPPIRMGFDNDRGDHMAQAGPGFPQPYSSHPTPPVPFAPPQPFNQGYSPHFPQAGQRPPIDPNPYNSQNRGRGGNTNNFRGRGGRGDFNNQPRGRENNRQFSNGGGRSSSDNFHKSAGADANGKKKKKRRTNTLGLTPNGVDHEDSDEEIDDVDEEARLVTLLGPDTPQLPTDLDAWLAERKSRFPTKARREAAAAEELRQRGGQVAARPKKESKNGAIKTDEGESKLEKQQRKLENLRLQLEKAEKQIQDTLSGGAKRKREDKDEGDDASDGESSASGSVSGSDSKPEIMSSRNASRQSQPPKAQLQRHCKYFSTGGTCGKKGKCRFVHDQEVRNQALRDKEANGGKMTLAQRLILNDTAKDDLTILKSIKYLKEKGLMSEQLTSGASRTDDDDMAVREENGYENNLSYGDS